MTESSTGDTGVQKAQSKTPRFVRWAVMLGIVIALNTFFLVLRSLVLTEPQYNDYCKQEMIQPTQVNDVQVSTYYQECQKQFDDAQHHYALYAFTIEIVLGIIAIVLGILPLGSSIVSSGLSYGGVLALLIAAVQYWGDAGTWIRFGVSLIALAALIYIGLKKFRD